MKLNRTLTVLAGLLAGLSLSASATAQVTGNSFKTTISITAACSMGTTGNSDMSFGTAASTDGSKVNETTPAGFSVICTNLLPFQVGLQPLNGDTSGAGVMTGAVNTGKTIAYQLYSDAGRSTKWGNVNTGTINTKSGIGAGSTPVTFSVYGKLGATLASQNLPVDDYSDTVAITVYY